MAEPGDVTPTPWNTDREYPEEVLAQRIAAVMDHVPPGQASIINFHCPAYGSGSTTPPSLTRRSSR